MDKFANAYIYSYKKPYLFFIIFGPSFFSNKNK